MSRPERWTVGFRSAKYTDDHDPDCGRNIPGGGGRHPLCESCLEDEEDLVKKAQFAMDHGTIEHPGNATKAEIVEAERDDLLDALCATTQALSDVVTDSAGPYDHLIPDIGHALAAIAKATGGAK